MRKFILSTILAAGIGITSVSASEFLRATPSMLRAEEENPLPEATEPFSLLIRQSRLHIEIAADYQTGMVSMYDILGNKVFELPANDALEFPVANLKSGLYFVVLKGSKGSFTKKILHKQEG